MHKHHLSNTIKRGFALPTILIASVVMLIVLLTAVQSVVSSRTALDTQYYNQLAREAAESGLVMAELCLRSNDYTPTWSDTSQLRPNTGCAGGAPCNDSESCFVFNSGNLRSTFFLGDATADGSGRVVVRSQGRVELLRSSTQEAWRTYEVSLYGENRYISSPMISSGAGWLYEGRIGTILGANGQLFVYGDNTDNRLIDDSIPYITSPVLAPLPVGVDSVSKVYTTGQGASGICIIGSDGRAYCRGSAGLEEVNSVFSHHSGWFSFSIPSNETIVDMSINGQGSDVICLLSDLGRMYCAGDNDAYWANGTDPTTYGLLGTGDLLSPYIAPDEVSAYPLTISGVHVRVQKVYAQDRYVCAITGGNANSSHNDRLFCTGNNRYGTIGNGTTGTNITTPTEYVLPNGRRVRDVISSYHENQARILHVLATDGTIWGSGRNTDGVLGNGTTSQASNPVRYGTRSDYVAMVSGPRHFCGITSGGNAYCTGSNTYGEVGTGTCTMAPVSTPTRFALPTGQAIDVSKLTANNRYGYYSQSFLTTSGRVYSAGRDEFGKFGSGTTGSVGNDYAQCSIVQTQLPQGVTIAELTTLDEHSMHLLGSNGMPYSSGLNNTGQLGNGTNINTSTPTQAILPRALIMY